MNDKLHSNSNNAQISSNTLIDDNYYSLVLEKISRELIKNNCIETEENQTKTAESDNHEKGIFLLLKVKDCLESIFAKMLIIYQ